MTTRLSNPTKLAHMAVRIFLCNAFLWSCKTSSKAPQKQLNSSQLSHWNLSFQDSPKSNWELSGQEVQSTYQRVYLKSLTVLESESGLSLKGTHGTWSLPDQILTLHHAELKQGEDTLLLPHSHIDLQHNLWQGGPFMLKGESWELSGQSFQAELPFNRWSGRQIHAKFDVENH